MSKIVILGGGESGVGSALLAKAKGFEVFLSDMSLIADKYKQILIKNTIDFEEGTHSEAFVLAADEVIKSPGISDKVEIVQKIKSLKMPVLSEIEFASRYTKAKIIAITGSNGKTTTTLLTYHLLKNAGLKVGLAGNVGESFAKQVIEDTFDYFVIELSSFQLDNCYNFKADISILLNITPDHLDRYAYDFQNYIDSKFRILQNTTVNDHFIYFEESEVILNELSKTAYLPNMYPVSLKNANTQGGFLKDEKLNIQVGENVFVFETSDLPIKGQHNIINALCASLVAKILGLNNEELAINLKTFQAVEHRLEKVRELNGVQFINDSKATNVDSVFYALGSFSEPIILIMGGVDKGNDYKQIENLVTEKVKALICLGKDNAPLLNFFGNKVPLIFERTDMIEAVSLAQDLSESGEIVLLSPACASFDLFKNYEDRGKQFKNAVMALV